MMDHSSKSMGLQSSTSSASIGSAEASPIATISKAER